MNLVQTRKCSFLIMEPNVKVNIDGSLLKKYANWDKPSCSVCTFFSRFEGTRGENKQIFLSDDAWQEDTLKNIREAVKINNFSDSEKVSVEGLTWGDYTEELFDIGSSELDFIIGSDLFFDPEVFEPLLITISYLLEQKPDTEVLIAVQERSSDWSIEELLIKWRLKCCYIYPRDFLRETGIEEGDLTGKHSIFLLKIFPSNHHGNI